MAQRVIPKVFNAAHWLTSALMVAVSVLFAGALLGSGFLSGKPGLIVCGVGWALITVPVYYRQHPAKQVTRGSVLIGSTGLIIFLLGLSVHAGAL